ncbi:hypothetical protein [Rhodococcus rhodochrous]|uniref:hypothetical protein n=1 Tax=Rhodococcus rhodochrous TaxID=1829 RepID=UPI0002F2D830|nr:hypothetical protein [Rhodococcus rhodochrous]
MPREIVIGSDLNTPRPTWSGPVYWYTTVEGGIPAHAITGDSIFVYEQTVTAIAADYFTRADGALGSTPIGAKPWTVVGTGPRRRS